MLGVDELLLGKHLEETVSGVVLARRCLSHTCGHGGDTGTRLGLRVAPARMTAVGNVVGSGVQGSHAVGDVQVVVVADPAVRLGLRLRLRLEVVVVLVPLVRLDLRETRDARGRHQRHAAADWCAGNDGREGDARDGHGLLGRDGRHGCEGRRLIVGRRGPVGRPRGRRADGRRLLILAVSLARVPALLLVEDRVKLAVVVVRVRRDRTGGRLAPLAAVEARRRRRVEERWVVSGRHCCECIEGR